MFLLLLIAKMTYLTRKKLIHFNQPINSIKVANKSSFILSLELELKSFDFSFYQV